MKHTVHTNTYIASDKDDNKYIIYEFTEYLENLEGLKLYKTSDGLHVNKQNDSFIILGDGMFELDYREVSVLS